MPVKIGRTANPDKRIASIRTCSPFGARYAALYETVDETDAAALERSAHIFLRDLRVASREWFDIESRSAAAVVRGMAAYDGIAIREIAA